MTKVLTTGTIVADIVQADLPKIADQGEMLFIKERGAELHVGGHPNNVAIDLVKLGANPIDIGIIIALSSHPEDKFSDFLEFKIKEYGFQTFIQRVPRVKSSTNIILVKKGEDRRFHLNPGQNLYLRPDFVKKTLKSEKPKIFCFRPGYTGIDNDVADILSKLKENSDTFVLLDVCRPFEKPWDYIMPAIKHVDAIHGNEGELTKITGTDNYCEAADKLLCQGASVIFITFGEKGASLIFKGGDILLDGFTVEAVDPTGCGDAFCAGIIYKMLEWGINKDLHVLPEQKLIEMLNFAQATGAAAATAAGCTKGVARSKVELILKS